MSELVLIGGLPGSGKSTNAKDYHDHYLHYETDHLFKDCGGRYRFDYQLWKKAREFVYDMADFALSRGENVVVCDLFNQREQVQVYEILAEYHHANLTMIKCEHNFKSVHRVPLTVLDKIMGEDDGYFPECVR